MGLQGHVSFLCGGSFLEWVNDGFHCHGPWCQKVEGKSSPIPSTYKE